MEVATLRQHHHRDDDGPRYVTLMTMWACEGGYVSVRVSAEGLRRRVFLLLPAIYFYLPARTVATELVLTTPTQASRMWGLLLVGIRGAVVEIGM